jgi:hypothetical protein
MVLIFDDPAPKIPTKYDVNFGEMKYLLSARLER